MKKKLVWPSRVWLVQSATGAIVIDRWFHTRASAKRAAEHESPGNDWKAVSFVPAKALP